jgi:polar amino acid transport system substrate-binding protein
MMCRKGNRAANGITRIVMFLVQGMPMVVLLMVLYYIVFGQLKISGLAVAVIGFTLTFGSSVYSLLGVGVGAVDKGQYEAAYMLGYSDRRIFYKIILPQALPHIVPSFKGEVISLIKSTSIVGYIAVQDLTKIGDLIRSRTYEAFFPLIAVTVIYFLLEGILRFGIGRIELNVDSKRRKTRKLLKGVKTDD